MRSIVRGIVALVAAFLMMDVAKAAPTIVSPADYATVKTMTDAMHDFLYSDAMLDPDTFTYTQTEYIAKDNEYRYVVTDERKAYMAEYNSNTIPVVFKWSAATDHSGDYTVTVKRVKDGKTVFTQTTSSTTVTFYDPEVGRNYIWTVTDNTGSVTGHFYTDRRGPRIIYSETSHLTNTRDLGGWTTTDGKVVKQGLIYRAPEWEWSARQKTETGNYFEMPYLRDVLGIKLEVDLRGRDSNTGGSSVTGQTYIDYFKCGSVYESTIDSSIPRFFCEHAGSTVAFPGYEGFNSSAANRIAVWHTFTNFCDVVKADGTTKPVIFHCSHGKDRTGSLAYVLLGVLGVPRDSLERDWALSWYSEGKYDVCMNKNGASKTPDTTNEWALDKLITVIDNNYSGATLKERCYNYLLACAKNASVSEANAKALIDNYISIMLEEPETAAVNPDPNAPRPPEVEEPEVEVDEFVYTDYYFRGFGGFDSYYRWYKDLNQSSMCKDGFSPISYNNRIFIQPNATEKQALGVYSRNCTGDMAFRTGMIVCDASKRDPNGLVGIYDCPFYFSSEGHTVSERCIFEHRAGRSEWTGVHFYFVDPYNTSKSVYDGLASFDVWGGSTLCISGFISKSPDKTYLKFPADNCNNARVEVFYDDKENYSTLGWFTGGLESTKQYFQVTNAFMQFTTPGKVNGVAGALGLEFGLGVLNKTTTDPLLKITGTFKVNPGSTITVNAGGKSAGTYKLISAGTLNDGADLVANSSVVNCASGHYGVVRKSGNAINLVIIKGTPPSTGDTVIDPTVYGSADTSSSTYTWRGYTGPWAYTTNWTASASANYGIPNNGTYATADFPATLANAFTCTLDKNYSVKYAKFDAPNMTLVIDNAALTVTDRANPSDYLAYGFGTGENANATLEFRGASAGIVSSKSEGRCMFGLEKSATDKLRCTVSFIVPATGWESTAPIRATGGDCSVYFWHDAKLVIDATALGVPEEGAKKTVLLATASDYLANNAKVELTCAAGAKGTVAVVDDNKLVLTVEAGEMVEEPVLTAVDAPVAQTGLVYTGSELTGVVASTGYTLTGNMATDAGEYTALATLAEGYKWSDGSTDNKEISWSIAKATNEWTTEPSISLETWTQGETAGVLTAGVAKFGEVTSTMTELPTDVGSYTITYTVAETKNYTGLAATVQFEIKEMVAPGDLIAVKPTVNYASGTKFTAIGVEQKPILTPVSGEGYKVSYEGDFTSSGTHKIIITLDNNWKWSDGSSDILVFQYTFVDRNFTKEFYASGSGRFQSSSRWYNKALTTKLNAYPTEYTHKAYSTTASSSAHMDDSLETKVGMFVVSGGEYKLTYGVLNFQNETVTHLPMWVTEPGCMTTIQATKMPLNGGGVGYFELGAGATNRFGLVDASENFYIRYATDGDLGSVTEFYDSGDSPVNTKLGWFEGGAEGIVSELIVTNTSVKFAKVGAISGVAGPLAVTVALGENNIERPSIDVVGTLKINQGSTLNVNANGMPCGVYTIITAGEFIGADILTTDQGGVVTGLAENTSGVIEREGNTIKLYIETTILPTVPGIDGESVSINDVFNSARVSKPIWYKTRPEIIDGKIVFNRIPVEIPEYYNVNVEALTEGYLIKLVLKDNLTPYIGNKVNDDVITTPAIKVENGKVKIHLEGTHEKLHYSLMTSTSVDPSATWTTANGDWTDNANFTFGDGDQKLDDVRFFKVGEVSDEPIE